MELGQCGFGVANNLWTKWTPRAQSSLTVGSSKSFYRGKWLRDIQIFAQLTLHLKRFHVPGPHLHVSPKSILADCVSMSFSNKKEHPVA